MSVKRKVTVPVGRFFKSGLLGTSGAASQSDDTFGANYLPSSDAASTYQLSSGVTMCTVSLRGMGPCH